ncbi:MAG: hypothetical protein KDA27_26375 [Candidatus Eisenbacteria bacterium]|uniref:FlgD/Vpr Ig-like domain-containing protein n=1 Tax=Eiseniibacteriota bacterium TaxID=2212470 RepID=A0A956NH79_UNCEI|nr:hypothetical protein [Candidatus Eisenbacteria bacterium]
MKQSLVWGGTIAAAVLFTATSFASVPKQIFVEEFSADWCTFCPYARCAMGQMGDEFGAQLVHVDTHVGSSGIDCEGGTARASRYGVNGIPDVWFEGTQRVTGASSCPTAASQYRARINNLIASTGGVSSVDLGVTLQVSAGEATVTGVAELVDDVALSGLQMTLYVVEDPLTYCCDAHGGNEFHNVSRGIRSTPITLTYGGDPVEVQETFTIDPAWTSQNLYAVALVENISAPRTVHQSAEFRNYLRIQFDQGIASVPAANGSVEVGGTITNGNELADTFDLSVAGDEPWTLEFQVEGDSNWYDAHSISLASGESKDVTFRVTTDETPTKANAYLLVQAESDVYSAAGTLRVFNGSPAILVVDADNSGDYEVPFEDAIAELGYFYDLHEATSGLGPLSASMVGYDAIVWETGYVVSPLAADRGEALQTYLQSGGNLVLSSMGFTSAVGNTPELRALLGIDTYVSNTGADEANGVDGDPISGGENHVLVWPTSAADKTDTVDPAGTAATIFRNELGSSIALRNELTGGNRVVFSSVQHTAFDASAQHVAKRMIEWVSGSQDPSSVDGDVPFLTSRIDASPNPFSPGTDLSFRLSDWAASESVSLRIVDAGGRAVTTLVQGTMTPGTHSVTWNGTDASGHDMPNGLYFAVLSTADGDQKTKLVRIR